MNLFPPILTGREASPFCLHFPSSRLSLSWHTHYRGTKRLLPGLPPFFNPGSVISLEKNADALKCCKSYQTQEDSTGSAAGSTRMPTKASVFSMPGFPAWPPWAVENLPAMQETQVQSLEGKGNPLQYPCLENSMDRFCGTESHINSWRSIQRWVWEGLRTPC